MKKAFINQTKKKWTTKQTNEISRRNPSESSWANPPPLQKQKKNGLASKNLQKGNWQKNTCHLLVMMKSKTNPISSTCLWHPWSWLEHSTTATNWKSAIKPQPPMTLCHNWKLEKKAPIHTRVNTLSHWSQKKLPRTTNSLFVVFFLPFNRNLLLTFKKKPDKALKKCEKIDIKTNEKAKKAISNTPHIQTCSIREKDAHGLAF